MRLLKDQTTQGAIGYNTQAVRSEGADNYTVQVSLGGASNTSVTLYGRLATDLPWVALAAAYTSDTVTTISSSIPYLKAVLTTYGGTPATHKVNVEVATPAWTGNPTIAHS